MVPGGGEAGYLADFWAAVDAESTPDRCSIHVYPLIHSGTIATWADFYNGSRLDRARADTRAARAATPQAVPLWVDEGSPDWRVEGPLGRNLSFETAFVDMAGGIAAEGGMLFARQCLNSVINPGEPAAPGFWAVYVWKQLMGTEVRAVAVGSTLDGRQPVRAYCHHTRGDSALVPSAAVPDLGLTVLLINLNAVAVTVDVAVANATVAAGSVRHEFHFGPGDGVDTITVNGITPHFAAGSSAPPTLPALIADASAPVVVAPRAFVFVVLPQVV